MYVFSNEVCYSSLDKEYLEMPANVTVFQNSCYSRNTVNTVNVNLLKLFIHFHNYPPNQKRADKDFYETQ